VGSASEPFLDARCSLQYRRPAPAKVGLAAVLTEFVANGRRHLVNGASISREDDMARSDHLLLEAMERDENNPAAHTWMGRLRRLQNRLIDSKIELEKAIELDPNNTSALLQLGITLLFLGQPESARPHFIKTLQLNPRSQNIHYFYDWLGRCYLLQGQLDEAIDNLRKAHLTSPLAPGSLLFLSAALGLKGDVDEARATLAEFLKIRPDINSFAQLDAKFTNWSASSEYNALREKTVDVGLRRVGMPDE
jgi:adenylate cyclase